MPSHGQSPYYSRARGQGTGLPTPPPQSPLAGVSVPPDPVPVTATARGPRAPLRQPGASWPEEQTYRVGTDEVCCHGEGGDQDSGGASPKQHGRAVDLRSHLPGQGHPGGKGQDHQDAHEVGQLLRASAGTSGGRRESSDPGSADTQRGRGEWGGRGGCPGPAGDSPGSLPGPPKHHGLCSGPGCSTALAAAEGPSPSRAVGRRLRGAQGHPTGERCLLQCGGDALEGQPPPAGTADPHTPRLPRVAWPNPPSAPRGSGLHRTGRLWTSITLANLRDVQDGPMPPPNLQTTTHTAAGGCLQRMHKGCLLSSRARVC